MKMIIDIPEVFYEYCKAQKDAIEIQLAVKNGTPLPKEHGDLIDRKGLLRLESKWYHLRNGDVACPKIDIEHAPTIIEADKEFHEKRKEIRK